MTCYRTLEALNSFPLCSPYKVADKVSPIQFLCRAEITLAPQLCLGTENDRIVFDKVRFGQAAQPTRLAKMRVMGTTGRVFMKSKCGLPRERLNPAPAFEI
jgi:hypothetical protein